MDRTGGASEASPSPEPRYEHLSARARRVVGIVSDRPHDGPLEVNADAHIIINDDGGDVIGGDGVVSGQAGTIVAAHTARRTRDNTATTPTRTATLAHHHLHFHHHRGENDSGPYTDDDVLLGLQLLAI
jgi:hypothetical protein